jgi:tetratricopeptide (TPR) repeat protein
VARDRQFERRIKPQRPKPERQQPQVTRETQAPPEHPLLGLLRRVPQVHLRAPHVLRSVGNRTLQRLAQEAEFTAPPDVEERLANERGRGEPLAQPARAQMEGSLGVDLGAVRIHRDSQAASLSQDLGAKAFTHGTDVYFAKGEYAPATEGGQRVLAHELAHVTQQHDGAKLMVGGVHDPAEAEADAVADQVVRGLRGQAQRAAPVVQRQEAPEEEELQVARRQEEEEERAQTLQRQPKEEEEAQTLRGQEGGEAASQDVASGETAATPDDRARALFTEGSQAYQEGAYSAALERFQQVLDIPGLRSQIYSAMLWNMARCHQRLGNREAAVELLRKYLAQSDIGDQDRGNAERLIAEISGPESGSNVTGTVETEEGGAATAAAEQVPAPAEETPLPTEPDERGRALYQRGAAAYRTGNYAEAVSFFNQVMEVGGLAPRAYATMFYNLARAYWRLGITQMALTMARGFLGQDSISAEDRADGVALLRQLLGETAAAGGAAEKLPERPEGTTAPPAVPAEAAPLPSDPVARGQALYAQAEQAYVAGRPADALALYNQVLGIAGLQPNVYATTLWNIARCHQRLGNNGAAIAMLRAFLAQPSLSDTDRADANELIAQLQRP